LSAKRCANATASRNAVLRSKTVGLTSPLAQQQRRRDGEAERLRGLEVDDQFQPHWLLNGEVFWAGPPDDLVDDRLRIRVHRRQPERGQRSACRQSSSGESRRRRDRREQRGRRLALNHFSSAFSVRAVSANSLLALSTRFAILMIRSFMRMPNRLARGAISFSSSS
jgi:hypothetical protein